MIPVTITNPNPDIQTGEAWFNEQDEATQRKILGPGKYDAWKAGKFEFGAVSKQVSDPVYGTMRVETPLKDLVGVRPGGIGDYLPDVTTWTSERGTLPPSESQIKLFQERIKEMPDGIRRLEPIDSKYRTVTKLDGTPLVLTDKVNLSVISDITASGEGSAWHKSGNIFLTDEFIGTPIQDHEYIHSLTWRNKTLNDGLQSNYNPSSLFQHAQNAQNQTGEHFTMLMTGYSENKETWINNIKSVYKWGGADSVVASNAPEQIEEVTRFLKELGLW